MLNLEIMTFVEQHILPRYNAFGASHNIRHAQAVIDESLTLARQLGADEDMAYVVAAYHDLGLEGPRAVHHLTSGRILQSDARLRRWFTPQQIRVMREAVEDHRASSSHAPRNIYGKIVAEADRELDPLTVCRRTVQYGLEHYPQLSRDDHRQRFIDHLINKYSEQGYIHLWLPQSRNHARLQQLHELTAPDNRHQLITLFNHLYDEET